VPFRKTITIVALNRSEWSALLSGRRMAVKRREGLLLQGGEDP